MIQLVSDKKQSLKEFTENNYAQASFYWTQLLKNRDIRVNGNRVEKDVPLEKGDVISYYLTKKQEEKLAFHIVYEDEHVLVIDKESGVNSEAVFSALSRQRTCYFIHRLDRNTRGIMVFALDEDTEKILLQCFKEHTMEKTYHALCFGRFAKKEAVLTAYLKKDATRAQVQVFDKMREGAEKIITEYKVLKEEGAISKVEVKLHTGKTHQIRAHLAYEGCPIVGDMKYGDSEKNKAENVSRQKLIAKYLRVYLEGDFAYINDKKFTSNFNL